MAVSRLRLPLLFRGEPGEARQKESRPQFTNACTPSEGEMSVLRGDILQKIRAEPQTDSSIEDSSSPDVSAP